jgi:hypothetical protein
LNLLNSLQPIEGESTRCSSEELEAECARLQASLGAVSDHTDQLIVELQERGRTIVALEATSDRLRLELEAETEARKQLAADAEVRKQLEADTDARKQLLADAEVRKQLEANAEARKQLGADTEVRKQLEIETEARKQLEIETEARKQLEIETGARKQLEVETEARKLVEIETEARKLLEIETEARKHFEIETEARKQLEAVARSLRSEVELLKSRNQSSVEEKELAEERHVRLLGRGSSIIYLQLSKHFFTQFSLSAFFLSLKTFC